MRIFYNFVQVVGSATSVFIDASSAAPYLCEQILAGFRFFGQKKIMRISSDKSAIFLRRSLEAFGSPQRRDIDCAMALISIVLRSPDPPRAKIETPYIFGCVPRIKETQSCRESNLSSPPTFALTPPNSLCLDVNNTSVISLTKHRPVDLAGIAIHIRNMSFDISGFLDQWDYQPNHVVVRKFIGDDGVGERCSNCAWTWVSCKMTTPRVDRQNRPAWPRVVAAGILHERVSYVEKFTPGTRRQRQKDSVSSLKSMEGSSRRSFSIITVTFASSSSEDFEGVIHDATTWNLRVFEFVEKYAGADDLAWPLQHLRPQHLMMRVRARGALALKADLYDEVIRLVEAGIEEIRQFCKLIPTGKTCWKLAAEVQSLEI